MRLYWHARPHDVPLRCDVLRFVIVIVAVLHVYVCCCILSSSDTYADRTNLELANRFFVYLQPSPVRGDVTSMGTATRMRGGTDHMLFGLDEIMACQVMGHVVHL